MPRDEPRAKQTRPSISTKRHTLVSYHPGEIIFIPFDLITREWNVEKESQGKNLERNLDFHRSIEEGTFAFL